MWRKLTLGFQLRLILAGGLNVVLLVWGIERLCKYSTREAQAWAHFWLAGTSFLVFILLWPILRRGNAWLRSGSALLSVLPTLILFAVADDYFRRL